MAVLRFSWLAAEKPASVLPQDTRSRPGPYQTIACFCLFSSCADGGSGPSTHAVRGRFFVPIEHRSYAQKIPGSGAEPQANRKLLGPGRTPSHAALRGRPFIMREDPHPVFLPADDGPDLVSLKLRDCESCYSLIVEPTTRMGCLFEPASDGIPGDLLYPSDYRLAQALHAECGDFVEGGATMLESTIRCAGVRAECLPATPAQISTTLSRAK